MANNPIDYLNDSLAAPLGNLISAIGEGVGEAQAALDRGSLEQTLALYEDTEEQDQMRDLLRQIGYQPTFYTLPETKVKAKVSLSLTQNQSVGSGSQLSKTRVYGTPMNAGIVNQFNVNLEASAEIEFTIKPVPPLIEARLVPNLVGKQFQEAVELLSKLGLSYASDKQDVQNTDIIITQNPEGGTAMKVGGEIALSFS